MAKLYFPHLMITPKKLKEIGACSRGCTVCRDNVLYETPINFDGKESFYRDLRVFFTRNILCENVEVTFLNYGDFFSESLQVQKGIANLFSFGIIPETSNIGVWTRANSTFTLLGIDYLKNWYSEGKLTLKISVDISQSLKNISQQILQCYAQLLKLENIKFPSNVSILLQLNNLEFMKLEKSQHIYLFQLIKKITQKFYFVQVICSDFSIKGDFGGDFFDDFFDYKLPHICTYLSNEVEYNLEKNFESIEDIYISHVDILEDAIAIHNPYCKRLQTNFFGTIYDEISTINANIRKFTLAQQAFSSEFSKNKNMICSDCNANFDSYMTKNHFV